MRNHGLIFQLYADDCQTYAFYDSKHHNLDDGLQNISKCLACVCKWLKAKNMKLNNDKIQIIHIGRPHYFRIINILVIFMFMV